MIKSVRFLHQKKQASLQWVQEPNQRTTSSHFRNKKKAYLKAKIEECETNRKIKNIRNFYRGIIAFKKGYQPRTNTECSQMNGAVSKVNKKSISHLTRAKRTPSAAATVSVSHVLITILQCVHLGSHDTHPHGNQIHPRLHVACPL